MKGGFNVTCGRNCHTSVRVPHSEKRERSNWERGPDQTRFSLKSVRIYLEEKKTACSSTMIILKITFPINAKMKFKSETTAVTTNKTFINKAFKANQLH